MKPLDMFISYSHQDESYLSECLRHLHPLEENGLIRIWSDKSIVPGQPIHREVNSRLTTMDVMCALVSSHYLESSECKAERNIAARLADETGVTIIPIIVSQCAWRDYQELSSILALPTDGKPISLFDDRDSAWKEVYEGVKKLVKAQVPIRQIAPSSEFKELLQDAGLLSTAHPRKKW